MPRRSILSASESESLLALPDTKDELIRHYTFSESDLSIIWQRRGNHNRIGFAVQMCYLRYPGFALPIDAEPPILLLELVGKQLGIEPDAWAQYAKRLETRREHLAELQTWLNLAPFIITDYRRLAHQLAELAQQTDRGIVLAEAMVDLLRQQRIVLPPLDVIERLCGEALTRGTRQVHKTLTTPLTDHHRYVLDSLLAIREGTKGSGLIWLRQPPGSPKPKHILAHMERLKIVRELCLPESLERTIHQNRLLKLAREGRQMTSQHLRDLEPSRRHATLVAVVLDTVRDATHVLDGLLYHESDLHIEEHYTDTAGFTDHVFALMHLLGFRFAPRIRDLADKRLYIYGDAKQYPTLAGLIGGNVNVKHIRAHWDEILRLAASIKQGTVTASAML
jgi:TnpA family transposase